MFSLQAYNPGGEIMSSANIILQGLLYCLLHAVMKHASYITMTMVLSTTYNHGFIQPVKILIPLWKISACR